MSSSTLAFKHQSPPKLQAQRSGNNVSQSNGENNNSQGGAHQPAFLAQFQHLSLAHQEDGSSYKRASPIPLALPASGGSVAQMLEAEVDQDIWTPSRQELADNKSAEDKHPAIQSILGSCQDARDRIHGIEEAIGSKNSGVPPLVLRGLKVDIQGLDTTFKSISNCLDFLQQALDDKTVDAAKTTALFHKNEKLRNEVHELNSQIAHHKEHIESIKNLNSEIQAKHEQELQSLKEQLESTRNLWLQTQQAHEEEKKRFVAQASDRNMTPNLSASSTPGFGPPRSHAPWQGGPSHAGPLVVANQQHRMPMMQTPARNQYAPRMQFSGSMRNHGYTPSSVGSSGQVRYNFSDDGVPAAPNFSGRPFMPNHNDKMGYMNKATEALVADAALQFDTLFRRVVVFAETFCRVTPGAAMVSHVKRASPRLWEYMCEALYPGNAEAGVAHASHLVQNNDSLPYFASRLVIQYMINSILSHEFWMGFSHATDSDFMETNARLQVLDTHKTPERHAILKTQAAIIDRIINTPAWPHFKDCRLKMHRDRVQSIFGPFLYHGKDARRGSGSDVQAMTESTIDLSIRLFKSLATYQYNWSDTCCKFSEQMHRALNNQQTPMRLQMQQWRLKLVVTPFIQLRDDSSLTVGSKYIAHSQVLVMN